MAQPNWKWVFWKDLSLTISLTFVSEFSGKISAGEEVSSNLTGRFYFIDVFNTCSSSPL